MQVAANQRLSAEATGALPELPTCKACSAPFDPIRETYCHRCGQDTRTTRFTLRSFISKAFLDAFDIHHGLLHTAVALTRHPGPTIREYILGNRVHHYNPVKYFLLMFTISVLVDEFTGSQGSDMHRLINAGLTQLGGARLMMAEIPLMLLLLVLYGMAFIVSIRLVRAQTYNVPETLTFLFYSLGHYLLLTTLLLLPITLLWPAASRWYFAVTYPGFLAFLCWCAYGFYSNSSSRAIGTILGGHFRMLPLLLLLGMLPYAIVFLTPMYILVIGYFSVWDLIVWLRHKLYGEEAFQRFLVKEYGRKKAAHFKHWGMLREGINNLKIITSPRRWRGWG